MQCVKPDKSSPTSGLQEAIDSNESGYIILSPGEYHIRDRLIIRSGTMLLSNNKSILINDLSNIYDPFIQVQKYSDIPYLIANSNNKSGISVGESGNNNINIGYLKIYNTGNKYDRTPMKALVINVYNIIINSLDVFLGNMGLSLENSSDIRINEAQIVNCSTGIRMFNGNNINMNNFSIDSCYYRGLQIDSTENSYFKGTIWNNNIEYCDNNNEYGVLIGKYSNERNNIIKMDLRIIDTGKTAIDISNSSNLSIDTIISNNRSGNIRTGIKYGNSIKNINVSGIMNNVDKFYTGEKEGKNTMLINGP
jgi:hypothetical protein